MGPLFVGRYENMDVKKSSKINISINEFKQPSLQTSAVPKSEDNHGQQKSEFSHLYSLPPKEEL